MTFISQALWGALFCIPRGFSFTALRFSTLTLSLVGIVGFYVLMRQLRSTRPVAIIGTLLLAFNPVYFALSNSFMSDVPFAAAVILSLLFFVRFIQTDSVFMLIIATVLAIVATLSRQLGLAIPLAFTATLLLRYGVQRRRLLLALLPSVLVVGIWAAYNRWLRTTGRVPAIYNLQIDQLVAILKKPWTVPLHVAHHGWNALMYFGCFLLPLLVLVPFVNKLRRPTRLPKIAVGMFIALTIARFIALPGLMPVHGNILDPRGIGPFTLQDTQLLGLPHVRPLPLSFWFIVTAFTLLGAGVLIFRATEVIRNLFWPDLTASAPIAGSASELRPASHWRSAIWKWRHIFNDPTEGTDRTIALFFLICSVIYLSPLVICGFFDRYLIPTLVFLTSFAVITKMPGKSPRPWQYGIAILLIGGAACYSVAGTRDYLTWNRTRWTALHDLQQANVPPEKIDGGLEFNGWYFYHPNYRPLPGQSDWWVVDDEYLLSFGEKQGYEKFKEYDYRRWLPPSQGSLFVLKRKDSASRNASSTSGTESASFNLRRGPPGSSANAVPR